MILKYYFDIKKFLDFFFKKNVMILKIFLKDFYN